MNFAKPYYGLMEALIISGIVCETDLTGRILFVNDQFCEVTGYRESELIGKHISVMGAKIQSSSFFLNILNVIFNGEVWNGEICMVTKDGSFYWVETTIAPIKHEKTAETLKYVVIYHSINPTKRLNDNNPTKRFEYQFEQIKARADLQKQLLEIQKMQGLGKLTSGIAHDFNNVVGCILGYNNLCENLIKKIPDEDMREDLSENLLAIKRAAERANELIKKILEFLRIENQKEITPINAPLVIKEVVNMLQGVIPKSINIETSFAQIPDIVINPIDLHQVITNLVVNARDAIDNHGNIKIDAQIVDKSSQCTVCLEDLNSKFVQITVADDGSGIEPGKIKKIFDEFFTTKGIGKGTGLGLLTVSNIVHNVGGHIVVDSQLGKGTAFKVLFPVFDKKEFSATVSAYLSTKEHHAELEQKSLRILVVDDDKENVKLVDKWLSSNNQQCSTFTNSEEALLHFIKNSTAFDVIISDNVMPNLTGVELAKVVLGLRPTMPIIIVSGTIEDIAKDDPLFELQNIHFLRKPVNFNEVADILNTLDTI
jgi:PAS domain S-box-containing protein